MTTLTQTALPSQPPIIRSGYAWGFTTAEYGYVEFPTRRRAVAERKRYLHEQQSAFETGQTVTVYQDPLTEQQPEGQASLLRFIDTDGTFDFWVVRFEDEWQTVDRRLLRKGKNNEA